MKICIRSFSIFFYLFTCASFVRAAPVLKHYEDPNGPYYSQVLQLALDHMDKKYELRSVPGDKTQARLIEDTKAGTLDVLWAGTSKELEDQLEPVRIPLFKGLLGHRLLIIRKEDQAKFDRVKTLADLQAIPLGQGTSWIDTKILEANGLKVIKTMKYQNLFFMLDGGRFDAFPRAVFEPFNEVDKHPNLNLTVEKNLLLIYKMDSYLFVRKEEKQLARDLEQALHKAIADGSFDRLYNSSPLVQEALQKGNLKNRTVIHLENPFNSRETPINDTSLWLDINSL